MADQQKLTVRVVPVADLVPDPDNARLHDERNLAAICASLTRFGQVEPLVVQKDTNVVVGGHGRLEGMKALGWDKARIVYVDVTDDERRALALALNRTAELASWDDAALLARLTDLQAEGWPLDALGWEDSEVASLVSGPTLDPTENVDPEPPDYPGDAKQGRPINLTQNQRAVFDQAVKRFRDANGDATEGRVVELLSADYLAAADPGMGT